MQRAVKIPGSFFLFVWFFLKKHKIAVFFYSFFAICAGFWGPCNSILIKRFIDLLPTTSSDNIGILLVPASLLVLNFILFDNVTWRSITYIRAKYVPVVIKNITVHLLDYCLQQSHQFYQENLSGKIAKQIHNITDGIERFIGSIASFFLRCTALLLIAFATAYSINPIFCIIFFSWFILFTIVSLFMSKKLTWASDLQAASESTVSGQLVDVLSNFSTVKIFSKNSYERYHIEPLLKKQKRAYTKVYLYSVMMDSLQGGLIATMMGFSAYYLSYLYGKNLVTAGDFALILSLTMEIGYIMWFTMSQVDEFNKILGRCKESLRALITPIAVEDKTNASALRCNAGKITFHNVKFHYQGTEPLFNNKSIEIKAGEKVGLVGYSGGGKSTFVNLILRFYDITDGAILIDDQDIRNVTQESLRESIGMIPQDPSLFHRSLMENIRYGKADATKAEVIKAAKKAHAHEFIQKLPQGYDSLVGERGVKLSGGQRQRVAIARAILKNAPILILDEATSQLDSVTEKLIQESLWELMQGKTTIVVAHRLSTLLRMDRVLVFDKGRIVEDGMHHELLAKAGLYKKLWDTQIGGFLKDEEDK